jgi:hypothetical protein
VHARPALSNRSDRADKFVRCTNGQSRQQRSEIAHALYADRYKPLANSFAPIGNLVPGCRVQREYEFLF